MRLAVYTDDIYRQDAAGVSGEQAFVRFITGLRPLVESLAVVGRLDPTGEPLHYRLDEDIRFVGLPFYESLTNPREVVRSLDASVRRFWRLLDDVDTVWLLGPYIHAIGFALLARLRRRRVALGVRQDLPRYVRSRHPALRWVHLAADALEAVFRGLARLFPVAVVGPDLAERYARSPQLLELMVSLVSAAEVVDEEQALARAERPLRRVLSVGRLDREKNPLLLVDAMAALRAADQQWRMVIVGDGPMRAEVQDRVDQLGLGAVVDVRGYVPIDGELPALYRSCDAFLHVSWTEGVPQVLFEAFAAGLPVVATDVGGVARAADGATLLIPAGEPLAAADALMRLAEERQLRETLIRRGLERVRTRTLEAETRRLIAFLEQA